MADSLGILGVPINTYVELGLHIPAGEVILMNRGPYVVFLTTSWSGNMPTGLSGDQLDENAWPLAPGQQATVRIPTYPVSQDTRVPAAGSVGGDSTLSYTVTGS